MAGILEHRTPNVSGPRAAQRSMHRRPAWLTWSLRPRRGHPGTTRGTNPPVRVHHRRQSRVPCGLTAVIRDERIGFGRFKVLNIAEGGMLVFGVRATIGQRVDFGLEGARLLGTGTARVVHRTDGAAGLAVERWEAPLRQAVHDLVLSGLLAESTWRELYGP
jgi:hypothetical protein